MAIGIRINRYLSMCGLGARRVCDELIKEGKVAINGEVLQDLSYRVLEDDKVEVSGKRVTATKKYQYYAFNKPIGVLTTTRDPGRRRTIYNELPPWMKSLKPVGRLDRDTEGLLLLTDDGSFFHHVSHPSGGVNKRYYVFAEGIVSRKAQKKLESGVKLNDGHTGRCKIVSAKEVEGNSEIVLDVSYGRKRMIRQMVRGVGHKILTLRRIEIGPIKLGDLETGKFRKLTEEEIRDTLATGS